MEDKEASSPDVPEPPALGQLDPWHSIVSGKNKTWRLSVTKFMQYNLLLLYII